MVAFPNSFSSMQENTYPINPPVKILHIINSLSVGGAEMMLYKLLFSMDRDRFQNAVISLMPSSTLSRKIKYLGIPVYHLEARSSIPSIKTIYRLNKQVQLFQPHIIQGWMYHGNLAAWLAHIFYRKHSRLIWNIRHSLHEISNEKKMTRWIIHLGSWLSKSPDFIVYNAEIASKQHKAIGYTTKNTIVIPNGFDTKFFFPASNAHHHLCNDLGVSNDTVFIGIIARYHLSKGHDNFITAAQFFKGTNIHFVMAGRNVDESNDALIKKINALDLKKQFHLLGEREDVSKLQAALAILTLASYNGEGFPNIIGEAMACGVPCVVTDIGDSPKIIADTGIVVPPKNPEALAQAWKKILAMPLQERKQLGNKARERIVNHYALATITRQYEKLYVSAITI